MKRALFIVAFIITFHNLNGAKITMEQMQQATEPVRLVCIQKSKVSESALDSMRGGKLQDVKELKCYVNCVLEMMQMVCTYGKVIYIELFNYGNLTFNWIVSLAMINFIQWLSVKSSQLLEKDIVKCFKAFRWEFKLKWSIS